MPRNPCPLRRVALGAFTVAGLALIAPCAARADDAPDTGPAVAANPSAGPAPEATADTGTVLGLEAFELMRRERREQRGAPRMLPLLATRAGHGRFWLGLTRGGSDATGERSVRLEMVWLIPLGR